MPAVLRIEGLSARGLNACAPKGAVGSSGSSSSLGPTNCFTARAEKKPTPSAEAAPFCPAGCCPAPCGGVWCGRLALALALALELELEAGPDGPP